MILTVKEIPSTVTKIDVARRRFYKKARTFDIFKDFAKMRKISNGEAICQIRDMSDQEKELAARSIDAWKTRRAYDNR